VGKINPVLELSREKLARIEAIFYSEEGRSYVSEGEGKCNLYGAEEGLEGK